MCRTLPPRSSLMAEASSSPADGRGSASCRRAAGKGQGGLTSVGDSGSSEQRIATAHEPAEIRLRQSSSWMIDSATNSAATHIMTTPMTSSHGGKYVSAHLPRKSQDISPRLRATRTQGCMVGDGRVAHESSGGVGASAIMSQKPPIIRQQNIIPSNGGVSSADSRTCKTPSHSGQQRSSRDLSAVHWSHAPLSRARTGWSP